MSKQALTLPLLLNVLPLVVLFASMIAGYTSLKSDVKYIKENTDELVEADKKTAEKLVDHEVRISLIEGKKQTDAKTSGSSAQLVSRPTIKPEPTLQPQVNTPQTHTQSVVIQQVQPTPHQQEQTPEPIITIPIISQLLEKL